PDGRVGMTYEGRLLCAMCRFGVGRMMPRGMSAAQLLFLDSDRDRMSNVGAPPMSSSQIV
ncbi:MAG TPA: hypothetical protein VMJ30_05465, partial [Gemmatimonadales bacterium]|nr:hypothetical protein [Gemmatimonadales bacterium]